MEKYQAYRSFQQISPDGQGSYSTTRRFIKMMKNVLILVLLSASLSGYLHHISNPGLQHFRGAAVDDGQFDVILAVHQGDQLAGGFMSI